MSENQIKFPFIGPDEESPRRSVMYVDSDVPNSDVIEKFFLSGLDDQNMPGIEEINVAAIMKTPRVSYQFSIGGSGKFGGRVFYQLERAPTLCPLNGRRRLSQRPIELTTQHLCSVPFDEYRFLFKHQISNGRRKASFHATREKAEERLKTFISLRHDKAVKEYRYCTAYMERLDRIVKNRTDHGQERRKELVKELTHSSTRKLALGGDRGQDNYRA